MSFSVRRVWSQITCGGPPCCPNAWFIETEIFSLTTSRSTPLHLLSPTAEGLFPGRLVDVVMWPVSRRVVRAQATGASVQVSDVSSKALLDLQNQYDECNVLEWDDLPENVRGILAPPK